LTQKVPLGQEMLPPGQTNPHVPLTQAAGTPATGQMVPQTPQLFTSWLRLTQAVPQAEKPLPLGAQTLPQR
jgi:hypothetical protein